jgi:multidrug efflux pump
VIKIAGFSLNNLSLMALTVATGCGWMTLSSSWKTTPAVTLNRPRQGSAAGAKEVGFHGTVDQRVTGGSVHSAAVHGGQVGRFFPGIRGHAVGGGDDPARHLLTTTPMMCIISPQDSNAKPGRPGWRAGLNGFNCIHRGYAVSLDWALDSKLLVMLTWRRSWV